jgi:hypothetical protein
MKPLRRAALLGTFAFAAFLNSWAGLTAQDTAAPVRPALTDEQTEQFLLNAKIDDMKNLNTGITNSRRATLSDGVTTHDAHIQIVDIYKPVFVPNRGATEVNFRDSYRYNIAGYKLARVLGLGNVPVSVERSVQRSNASVTWWVDDVLMDEGARRKTPTTSWPSTRTAAQIHIMRVFDELIANTDRNAGNLLWTTNGTMWMIDHTRAFRLQTTLKSPHLLERCERSLLERLRSLSAEKLAAAMGDILTKSEIQALLVRRDLIVKLFDDKIAQRGEAPVLYSFQTR